VLYILFRPAAGRQILSLYGWERERIADTVVLLSDEPRPPGARRLQRQTYEIWAGESRVLYRIIRNDHDEDIGLIITRVS